jgi:hypothetical protein
MFIRFSRLPTVYTQLWVIEEVQNPWETFIYSRFIPILIVFELFPAISVLSFKRDV